MIFEKSDDEQVLLKIITCPKELRRIADDMEDFYKEIGKEDKKEDYETTMWISNYAKGVKNNGVELIYRPNKEIPYPKATQTVFNWEEKTKTVYVEDEEPKTIPMSERDIRECTSFENQIKKDKEEGRVDERGFAVDEDGNSTECVQGYVYDPKQIFEVIEGGKKE